MSFGAGLKKFQDKAASGADKVRRAVALELFDSVILDTPVDTGRARGNWQTSAGAPIASTVERDGAAAATQEADSVVGASKPDSTLYMTNNLPYIEVLEDGSSTQAPAGMVSKNVSRIQSIIKREVSKLR